VDPASNLARKLKLDPTNIFFARQNYLLDPLSYLRALKIPEKKICFVKSTKKSRATILLRKKIFLGLRHEHAS